MKLPSWLWPIQTGKTFFDVWSVVHAAAGLIIGADLKSQDVSQISFVLWAIGLGYAWEVVETIIERRWPQMIKHPEGWLNRWVSDPLMVFLGALFGAFLAAHQ